MKIFYFVVVLIPPNPLFEDFVGVCGSVVLVHLQSALQIGFPNLSLSEG